MTLGSLFDGSGTCPLAAAMCGITPVWASEIEPYPIRVTQKNFPRMKHLGDITQINGAEIEPVDIVTFGSPCQDLSEAGAQKGLVDGKRSRLFFDALRIICEMREATNGKYPRYAVWENVPGAFSSNKGRDFLAVLRAFVEAAGGHDTDVPEPARKGRTDRLAWRNAGCIVGEGYSIAWRVLDAKYWGVPQRRKRIYLVADFGGQRAGEILFKREGLRGNFAQSREAGKEAAADAVGSTGGDCRAFHLQQDPISGRVSPCIGAQHQATVGVVYDIMGENSNSLKSRTPDSCFRERTVARTLDTFSGSPECNQGGNVVVARQRRRANRADDNRRPRKPCHRLHGIGRRQRPAQPDLHDRYGGNADMRTRSTDDLRIYGRTGRKGRGNRLLGNGIADAQSRSKREQHGARHCLLVKKGAALLCQEVYAA